MIILPLLALLFSLVSLPSPALAQLPDLEVPLIKAEQDYRYQFDLYRQSYQQYLVAKSQWQQSKTIKSEQEALTAAKQVAFQRAQVQKSYTLWLRLQLLNLSNVYPPTATIADQLEGQFQWFATHQDQVNFQITTIGFDTVMSEYLAQKTTRDKLFAMAQIHLKLAHLTNYQHQARSLYDPLLTKLQSKLSIPEVQQGTNKIATLGEQINSQITNAAGIAGSLESNDFGITQAFRKTSEALEKTRAQQLSLIDLMMELEQRYGQD